jgi:hypothetical protein
MNTISHIIIALTIIFIVKIPLSTKNISKEASTKTTLSLPLITKDALYFITPTIIPDIDHVYFYLTDKFTVEQIPDPMHVIYIPLILIGCSLKFQSRALLILSLGWFLHLLLDAIYCLAIGFDLDWFLLPY